MLRARIEMSELRRYTYEDPSWGVEQAMRNLELFAAQLAGSGGVILEDIEQFFVDQFNGQRWVPLWWMDNLHGWQKVTCSICRQNNDEGDHESCERTLKGFDQIMKATNARSRFERQG